MLLVVQYAKYLGPKLSNFTSLGSVYYTIYTIHVTIWTTNDRASRWHIACYLYTHNTQVSGQRGREKKHANKQISFWFTHRQQQKRFTNSLA